MNAIASVIMTIVNAIVTVGDPFEMRLWNSSQVLKLGFAGALVDLGHDYGYLVLSLLH